MSQQGVGAAHMASSHVEHDSSDIGPETHKEDKSKGSKSHFPTKKQNVGPSKR